ncbi:hypothetical protein EDB89DRAFT_2072476 [Lactarius sanguifluus]|nr:hypothetical protein EDB89DRAFT_2072476 [Lactarius sanguifluus]
MNTASQSVRPLSLPNDLSPDAALHRPYNGLNMEDRLEERENLRTQGKSYRNATTIDMLTDNVLVEIFDFCRLAVQPRYRTVWKWAFTGTHGTPVRSNLGVWPAIPIVIQYGPRVTGLTHHDEDNVIAALEHPDRGPFPALTCLSISSNDEDVPVIPSGFLVGSAPRLQKIHLTCVLFPSLPALFLSTCDLVELSLRNIPKTGYISPEVMVASLVMLPRLKQIDIGFLPPDSPPDQMLLPLITRSVLPALTCLDLSSICGSVEDFLARIDTPRLNTVDIHYSDQVVDFEVPQLSEFMNRSENLKRTLSGHCRIMVDSRHCVDFCIEGATGNEAEPRRDPGTGIYVCLLCEWIDRQTLHLAQVLSGISPRLSNIIHLAIGCDMFEPWNDPDDFEWLQLLRPFSSVRTLFVVATFARYVSPAGRDISRVIATEVLPALELLCLEDGPVSSIDELTAARRDSGRPVTIVDKKEFDKRLEAYPP